MQAPQLLAVLFSKVLEASMQASMHDFSCIGVVLALLPIVLRSTCRKRAVLQRFGGRIAFVRHWPSDGLISVNLVSPLSSGTAHGIAHEASNPEPSG